MTTYKFSGLHVYLSKKEVPLLVASLINVMAEFEKSDPEMAQDLEKLIGKVLRTKSYYDKGRSEDEKEL